MKNIGELWTRECCGDRAEAGAILARMVKAILLKEVTFE